MVTTCIEIQYQFVQCITAVALNRNAFLKTHLIIIIIYYVMNAFLGHGLDQKSYST